MIALWSSVEQSPFAPKAITFIWPLTDALRGPARVCTAVVDIDTPPIAASAPLAVDAPVPPDETGMVLIPLTAAPLPL